MYTLNVTQLYMHRTEQQRSFFFGGGEAVHGKGVPIVKMSKNVWEHANGVLNSRTFFEIHPTGFIFQLYTQSKSLSVGAKV